MVQVEPDQHRVAGGQGHARQRLLDGGPPALDVVVGERGQGLRAGLAAGDRLQDRPGRLHPGQRRHHGRQLDQGALQELLQPLPLAGSGRGPAGAWCGPGRAAPGSPAAGRTTGAAGPSRPAGRSTARRAGRSSAARPAAGPGTGWPAGRSARRPPAGRTRSASSPTSPPSPPAGPGPPAAARPGRGSPARSRGRCLRPATRGGRRRGPAAAGCTRRPSPSRRRSPRPARAGAGSPRPRSPARESSAPSRCHPGLLCSEPVNQAGCPGTRSCRLGGREY